MKIAVSYLLVLISLAVLDGIWLGFIAKSFYKEYLGHLFRTSPLWPAIIVFYLLYAAAIVYFAVLPSEGVLIKAFLGGALLGLTAYMTYDLVNFATLKDWPLVVVLVDIAWGGLITALAASFAVIAGKL